MGIVGSQDRESSASPVSARRVPIGIKLLYTAFCAVLVPYYWAAYGPTNFLYFCDLALLMTVVTVWSENALLASMAAVGIFLPQMLWCADFLAHFFGGYITDMTAYMFNPNLTLFTRGLSFFHFWLPFLVLWLVWRLGYDRRAFLAWSLVAWILLPVCYFLFPAPPPPADNQNLPVNVNYVYGFNDTEPQHWMPPLAFLALLMVGLPLLIYLPTHLLLKTLFRQPSQLAPETGAS